ncbi:MAG: glycine betaine ABC transporter substrate-binding protein [Actinomycetota bacterium]|nr:glycine betaine ABC transporter substrate-binding protein [Actinomycetota bacterium]
MYFLKIKAWLLLATLVAFALAATACGGESAGGGPGGGGVNLSGASFTVGSKEFTEQRILGQIAIQALQAAGAEVTDQTGIQGTANVRRALNAGEIDMYWEYTGTGWTTHLGHEASEAPRGTQQLYEAVATEDLQRNQVRWLQPAPMDNAYAIATAQGRDQQLGVRTLSDYAALANRDPAQASLCAATEFLTRDDGLPGLQQVYGFTLPPNEISEVDLGVIYTRVPSGDPCNFGEVFATDGRIVANKLQILEDDKQFFVKYNVAMTVNDEVFSRYPQLAQVLNPIAAKLTNETMRAMNARVDVEGLLPEQVAQEFLEQHALIS